MVTERVFGVLYGQDIMAIDISNDKGMSVTVLDLGATIQSIIVPDKDGKAVDVALGYDTPAEYMTNGGYMGATIGRHGNRIGKAQFTLNGKKYFLDANEGRNQLHGGAGGFDKKIWRYKLLDNAAEFTCWAWDMESGFPGNIETKITFSVGDDNSLTLCYKARCDKDTVANFTNHCYFNLAGHASGDIHSHTVKINASGYTPADTESIPTGRIDSVAGTQLDFRAGKYLSEGINDADIMVFGGFDHNFVLDGEGWKQAAEAYSAATGIGMQVFTTLEGMQLYSGNYVTDRAGKGGVKYFPRSGFCMETQHFPDAINHTGFPSPILRKGETLKEKTTYKFFVK